ncbi:hypothetical protein ACFXAZ_33180 [Streptomyces sp. NPDC059477]|uniref:hypothetical protein n=1 Tax=Streptomyces sp. NPDC059477 TaxID=3346847 RepID=UPI00367A197F
MLLVEGLPHLDTSRLHATWMDLRMLMLFGGGELTDEELKLAAEGYAELLSE